MIDDIDRRLLGILQRDFPLAPRPFLELGERLGLGETEVLDRSAALKREKLIRYIGPIFDPPSLGYATTLAAMKVPQKEPARAGDILQAHFGVSHAYLRDHEFNLWLTLAWPAAEDCHVEIDRLAAELGAIQTLDLPARRRFKLRAIFGSGEGDPSDAGTSSSAVQIAALSDLDRSVIMAVQQDLPLELEPFAGMAERAGLRPGEFICCCRSLLEKGTMRRYCASAVHTALGYQGNAMVCWLVPPDRVEETGRGMARSNAISHCYERHTHPGWPYNLYTMVHAGTEDECRRIIAALGAEYGPFDHLVLFTVKELKKARARYLV